ncbi:hypothetical protein TPHA_0C01620 [Tetrapisispora phaffii CBS 4417]|uniref:Transcription regulator LGE1 helical region domain-containing protein n=1 Tax=Tetrapisispora phaffii (strain ATCC 24235 / CBS 4417 / NBRC 1672 / NRRL Y-8282 / UCD 70-5) TaxID=1071381 RepID=G8BRE2_TETPH|nr:hypothetical protein TPHA_0C01620 [Tetrapisispora phaffii CBS 4417]CCE62318.1 hypothetical protein TPHA_0C01620 [Tetrapisispora phaffii CBS 4417]
MSGSRYNKYPDQSTSSVNSSRGSAAGSSSAGNTHPNKHKYDNSNAYNSRFNSGYNSGRYNNNYNSRNEEGVDNSPAHAKTAGNGIYYNKNKPHYHNSNNYYTNASHTYYTNNNYNSANKYYNQNRKQHQYNNGGYYSNYKSYKSTANNEYHDLANRGITGDDVYEDHLQDTSINNSMGESGYHAKVDTRVHTNSPSYPSRTSTPYQQRHHTQNSSEQTNYNDNEDLKLNKETFTSDISPFYYLTNLNEDKKNADDIKKVFIDNDNIDKSLQAIKYKILKTELEYDLLNTQGERDALNVQLTQENLDSILLM